MLHDKIKCYIFIEIQSKIFSVKITPIKMTAIGTMIISLSDTHTFAKPSTTRYIIIDLTALLSIFLSFLMLVQRYM